MHSLGENMTKIMKFLWNGIQLCIFGMLFLAVLGGLIFSLSIILHAIGVF